MSNTSADVMSDQADTRHHQHQDQHHHSHATACSHVRPQRRESLCLLSLTEYDPSMTLNLTVDCGGNDADDDISDASIDDTHDNSSPRTRSAWVSPHAGFDSAPQVTDVAAAFPIPTIPNTANASPVLGAMLDFTPADDSMHPAAQLSAAASSALLPSLESSDIKCATPHDQPQHRDDAAAELSAARDLGAGASGRVRGMHCPTLGVPIAVKTIRETTDSKRYNAACEFAYAQRVLECPEVDASEGLVRVLEVVRETESRVTHVAMEYLPGGNVAQLVAGTVAYPLSPTPADVDDESDALSTRLVDRVFTSALRLAGSEFSRLTALRRVAAGGLRGLHTLHAKLHVVHRDITPRNLLVDAAGDVKIADFGVAAVLPLDGAQPQEAREQAGSVAYMSPERLRGEAHGPASDVWALGVVLLELALGGQHPFIAAGAAGAEAGERFWAITTRLLVTEGEAACEEATRLAVAAAIRDADVDADFADLLRRMLAAHPDDRATAAALLSDPALLLF